MAPFGDQPSLTKASFRFFYYPVDLYDLILAEWALDFVRYEFSCLIRGHVIPMPGIVDPTVRAPGLSPEERREI